MGDSVVALLFVQYRWHSSSGLSSDIPLRTKIRGVVNCVSSQGEM